MSLTMRLRCVTKNTLESVNEAPSVALGFAILKEDGQPTGMGGSDFTVRVPLAEGADYLVDTVYTAEVLPE